MGLRPRGGKWHYRFVADGHEWTDSTGLAATERNRKAAESVEHQARIAIKQGNQESLTVRAVTFNEAADKFIEHCKALHRKKPKTWKRVQGSLSSLRAYFGSRSVSTLTAGDVTDYAAWRVTTHQVKDVTIRHDLHALSKFFRYAIKHNWTRENKVKAEDIPSDADAVRDHIFSAAEEAAYMHAAHPILRDLAALMLYQGCRPEEFLALRCEQVDLERRYLTILESKSKAGERKLRLRAVSVEILARRVRESKHGWVFAALRCPSKQLSLSSCENWHVKARDATGIACVIYDWRHTFASRAANSGMSLATLKSIMGHSDLRTLMRYVHPSQSDQDHAMDKADGLDSTAIKVTDSNDQDIDRKRYLS